MRYFENFFESITSIALLESLQGITKNTSGIMQLNSPIFCASHFIIYKRDT